MPAARIAAAIATVALLAGACGGWNPPLRTDEKPSTATPSSLEGATGGGGAAGPALVPGGCDIFDGTTLGGFSPIDQTLTLVESRSEPENLTCNSVGTDGGLDTAVHVVVDLCSAHSEAFFTTAADFESVIEIAGRPGVGTGRGTLRIQLDERRGMTLAVTIRALSSSAQAPRDGEYLSIRDAIAAYVIGRLN